MSQDRNPTLSAQLRAAADVVWPDALVPEGDDDAQQAAEAAQTMREAADYIEKLEARERKAIASVALADESNPMVQALVERVAQATTMLDAVEKALSAPTHLHRYDKGGIHSSDCFACRLRESVAEYLRTLEPEGAAP